MTTIVPRSHWGSKALGGHPMGQVSEVIVHHSWRPDVPAGVSGSYERQVLRSIEDYHIRTFYDGDAERGGGTGYQFLVFPSGRAYEGRGTFRTGAHTQGRNSQSIAICFVFDGDQHQATPKMWDAARACVDRALDVGALTYSFKVSGHRDYSPKTCPGKQVYLHIGQLREPPQEEDVPLSDDDVKKVADAVLARLQPDRGEAVGKELDRLRRDVRWLVQQAGGDPES